MANEHVDSKNVVLGLLIGGALGAGALYCLHVAQNQKKPVLKKIGKTIADVGEMIENCSVCSVSDAVESLEKKIPKGAELVNNLADWVDLGTTLWKKLRKE